jgi:hypothetical protein
MMITRASGAVTLEAPLTLPASNPTDANHATRKAYVDAGDVSVKLVDTTPSNNTVIDITGFSVQDYRMVTVHLLGTQLSSSPSSGMTAQLYRNASLVNTGYTFIRVVGGNANVAAATVNNGSNVALSWTGNNHGTSPLFMTFEIIQSASGNNAVYRYSSTYVDTGSVTIVLWSGGFLSSGSGWVDGVRITAPVAFQNDVGRVVVMGLKP